MAGEKPSAPLRAESGGESDQTEHGKIGPALTIITLKVYEQKGSVGHDNKILFNTVITVLNLALGLNFLEAFKDMAKVLRWRVLANRNFTVRETDLILGGESLINHFTLMKESMKKPLMFTLCAFWILLNILAQASIAMIGLNYSMDNGVDSTGITLSNGQVSFAKIACYYDHGSCLTDPAQPPEVAQNEAHAYGEASLREKSCSYNTDDDIYESPQNCTYFERPDGQEFAYRYSEYNTGDRAGAFPYLTKRLIKASTGQCFRYQPRQFYLEESRDGPESIRVYPYFNGTFNGTLRVASADTHFDSTTYAYMGFSAPQNASASDVTCGPRCIRLYAVRQNGNVTDRGADIFMCPITVSEVSNIEDPAHVVPDDTARLAAASIALSGRYTFPNDSDVIRQWQQYQWYPFGSYWELNNRTAQGVGSRMAEFAIGSLASMGNFNPRANIQGTTPTLGYNLSVHWEFIAALAVLIAGVHCLLVGLILWIARPVVVPDDSNLVVAKLLHGLVGNVGERGNLLEGKEIAEAIEKEGDMAGREKGAVGYGVREGSSGTVLEIGEGLARRKNLRNESFPRGVYA
ncbi:MAG: hypothetical protein Q9219_004019 [cf. Caloplaca sp. 3 TL-2023]